MTISIIEPKEIRSVSKFVEDVSVSKDKGKYLFRGQNVDKPLLPKIARVKNMTPSKTEAVEREMLERFKKESTPYLVSPYPRHDWDWLSIAQHQGMPTRLLDWSANSLAALWFAVANQPPANISYGVVWRLKITKAHLKSPAADNDIFKLRRTYVFQPFHIDKRIAAQSGWFSVHKYAESSDKFVPLDSNKKYKGYFKKYLIRKSMFSTIRRQLRLLGVTQATMFPDLSGLAADIQEEFLNQPRQAEKI